MTKVRRLSREEELHLQPERLLRARWRPVWKDAECGGKKGKNFVIMVYRYPELTSLPTAGRRLGKCLVSCSCSHVPYTMFDCTPVMSRQLSCKRQQQTSTNIYQPEF